MDDLLLIMTMLGSWHKMSFLLKSVSYNNFLSFFLNSHLSLCLMILERGERRGSEKERERDLYQLPPVHTPTGD